MHKGQGFTFFIMGVSGTGKSTIGKLLSNKLALPFYDGDDYHPKANIDKMAAGKPLNDDDRHDWLVQLNKIALKNKELGSIIACSSLKKKYRDILKKDLTHFCFIFLEGSFDLILSRMKKRKNHFMPAELLKSQFETLEIPDSSEAFITVSIEHTPDQIISEIINQLN
tara:strand:- start:4173 stop:4676 length:504 start_codon:yes stop_codon:yes gene_type:complete